MGNSDEKVIKHFPILEKMSTLRLEEKIILDEILSRYKKGQYLYKQSTAFRPLKSVMTEDVWKELHDLGVVEMFRLSPVIEVVVVAFLASTVLTVLVALNNSPPSQ